MDLRIFGTRSECARGLESVECRISVATFPTSVTSFAKERRSPRNRQVTERQRTMLQRDGKTGLGLQPAEERLSHRRGSGPESSVCRHMRYVARQADAALCDHLGS
jgi:hypothetical protein